MAIANNSEVEDLSDDEKNDPTVDECIPHDFDLMSVEQQPDDSKMFIQQKMILMKIIHHLMQHKLTTTSVKIVTARMRVSHNIHKCTNVGVNNSMLRMMVSQNAPRSG